MNNSCYVTPVVFLVRHGIRIDMVDDKWLDSAERHFDPFLAPEGHVQAKALVPLLKNKEISAIYTSPFVRTIETAYPLAESNNIPIKIEPLLGEWHNPQWFSVRPEVYSTEILADKWPVIDKTYSGVGVPQYPETEEVAISRQKKIAQILCRREQKPIMIVTHEHCVKGILRGLCGDIKINNAIECGSVMQLTLSKNKGLYTMKKLVKSSTGASVD